MNEHLRAHPRKPIQIQVQLRFLDDAPIHLITRDISDGGLFLLTDEPEHFTLGELVNLQYKNPLQENSATEKDAAIVRISSKGIAVSFIEMDAF